jgi:hypothetical protein
MVKAGAKFVVKVKMPNFTIGKVTVAKSEFAYHYL